MSSLDATELDLPPCSSSAIRKDWNGETPIQEDQHSEIVPQSNSETGECIQGLGWGEESQLITNKSGLCLLPSLLDFFSQFIWFIKWKTWFQDGTTFHGWHEPPQGSASLVWILSPSTFRSDAMKMWDSCFRNTGQPLVPRSFAGVASSVLSFKIPVTHPDGGF